MSIIHLKNIRIYAYHGCLAEEAQIGSDYLVNLKVKADLSKASQTDCLEDTADYVHLNRIVKEEMAVRSKLLEHVANRITERVFCELPAVEKAKVSVSKINPPIGGDVEEVAVVLKKVNDRFKK